MCLRSGQTVHRGRARLKDRIRLARLAQTPSVENYQRRDFRPAHRAPPVRWKTLEPGETASAPNSSPILISRLYLAVRSPRLNEPVLIWPAPVATARSAIVVSSVSPERWEMTHV